VRKYTNKRYALPDLINCYIRYLPTVVALCIAALVCLWKIPGGETEQYQVSFNFSASDPNISDWASEQVVGVVISESSLREYADYFNSVMEDVAGENSYSSRDFRALTCETQVYEDYGKVFHLSVLITSPVLAKQCHKSLGEHIVKKMNRDFYGRYSFLFDKGSADMVKISEKSKTVNYICLSFCLLLAAALPIVFDLFDPKIYTAFADGADLVLRKNLGRYVKKHGFNSVITDTDTVLYDNGQPAKKLLVLTYRKSSYDTVHSRKYEDCDALICIAKPIDYLH